VLGAVLSWTQDFAAASSGAPLVDAAAVGTQTTR